MELLQNGDVEGLVAMLVQHRYQNSFRSLGQALLWQRHYNDFERLLQIGLTLKDGEALVIDLGLQLVPPGLPGNSWATPPLSELLEVGYKMVEAALSGYPEPAELFRKFVVMQQAEVSRQSEQGHPRHGWG